MLSVLLLSGNLPAAGVLVNDPAAAPRVSVTDIVFAAAVRRTILGASTRLEHAECQRIFTDFKDTTGRPLLKNLRASGLSATAYLFSHVLFVEDSEARQCRRGPVIAAFTAPGESVVRICGPSLSTTIDRSTSAAELLVLHELLHTLGLGENPPTPADITRQLRLRCTAR